MGKNVRFPKKRNSNIIPVHMDAVFFYERAIKSLDKYDYQKAIRYFRKAIELEPGNPVHYCNLAGTLSEMGRFEESNKYLYQVIESIDPDMTECYFYLANNFINMDQILQAEKYVLDYLELDRLGEFRDDAEEMLNYISHELGRPPLTQVHGREKRADQMHEKAKRLMEQGCFIQASNLLKKLLEAHPEYTAARNNLALCHYYMGELEEGLDIVRSVLEQEPHNIHALCNQAIFYSHLNMPNELTGVLDKLSKVVPMQFEEIYKLATTLGILGRHESAYFLFRKLAKYTMYTDPVILHYAAISAYNLDKLNEAKQWWEKAKNLFPQSVVFDWFIEKISQKAQNGADEKQEAKEQSVEGAPNGNKAVARPFPYYFRWDVEKNPATPENSLFNQAIRHDPMVRSSFLWALRYGDMDTKMQVLQALGYLGDQEAEETLRRFLLQPKEDDYVKTIIILMLYDMGAKEPYRAFIRGKEIDVYVKSLPRQAAWMVKWHEVKQCFRNFMENRYEIEEHLEAEQIWIEFLSKSYPHVPQIRKVETWAAAVEYIVARRNNRKITQREIAERYGISTATLANYSRKLEEATRHHS